MTFKEAQQVLKGLAGGKYHSLKFTLNVYADGLENIAITAYVHDIGYTADCGNYELALANMEALIQQKDNPQLIDEMMPEF